LEEFWVRVLVTVKAELLLIAFAESRAYDVGNTVMADTPTIITNVFREIIPFLCLFIL
jgi:hypothetical protein